RSTVGSGCWTLELRGFVRAPLVDYPFPNEQVSIVSRTPTRILLKAFSSRVAYEELSDVNPRTFFDYRDVEITYGRHRAHRVFDESRPLRAQTPRPSTAPMCPQS